MDVLELPVFKEDHPLYSVFKITERMKRSAVVVKKEDNHYYFVSVDTIAEAVNDGSETFANITPEQTLPVVTGINEFFASELAQIDNPDEAESIINTYLYNNNATFVIATPLYRIDNDKAISVGELSHQWPLENFHYHMNENALRHENSNLLVHPLGLFSDTNERISVAIGDSLERIHIATLMSGHETDARLGYEVGRYCHCDYLFCFEAYPVAECQQRCGQRCKKPGCGGSMNCPH